MAEQKAMATEIDTEVYVLSITLKSAKNLPDLDFGSKDKTDPVCKISFQDAKTGTSYVWRSEEIYDELDPVWNQTNSWPLFFEPSDDMEIRFEVWDIDSFSKSDEVGFCTVKLKDLDGSPKLLKGKKCTKNTTITAMARKHKLQFVKVDEKEEEQYVTQDDMNKKLQEYAKLDVVTGLQSTVQKIQAETISNAAKYATKKEVDEKYVKKEEFEQLQQRMQDMQQEYEAKLKEMTDALSIQIGVVTSKLDGMKKALTDV